MKFVLLSMLLVSFAFSDDFRKSDSLSYEIFIPKYHIVFKLKGNVKPTNNTMLFVVDNHPMQYLVVEGKKKKGDLSSETAMISEYIKGEVSYLATNVLKTDPKAQMLNVPIGNGKEGIFWWYKMPRNISDQIEAQLFFTIVLGDNLFGVSTSQVKNQSFDDALALLINTISTAKMTNMDYKECSE